MVAPAIELAADGFEVSEFLALRMRSDYGPAAVGALEHFSPGGEPLAAGERLVQEDLAGTMRTIADGGADAFYQGELTERSPPSTGSTPRRWPATPWSAPTVRARVRRPHGARCRPAAPGSRPRSQPTRGATAPLPACPGPIPPPLPRGVPPAPPRPGQTR
ncbi:gamma-glutamyltransferase [Georgenia sp. SUBG003]|uniref:gamma-glutamyltransferase n=1 Tax=Georgenia sp. SUBG003 TaxID=1497974 RepID=UPI003AB672BF